MIPSSALRRTGCALLVGALLGAVPSAPAHAGPRSALTLAAAGEKEPLRRVGIYPLERLGPSDPAYDRVQTYLRKNLGLFPETEAFDLATPSKCKADDLQCLVNVGRLAAADLVVHGSVERFNDGYAVRLQLIDVGRTTRREVKRLIQGGGDELIAAMELAACELLTTEKCQGTLRVEGPAGARVLIAARDVGPVPFQAALPIGRHSVRVAKGGLSTEDKWVSISFRQQVPLRVEERNGLLSFVDSDFEAPLPPPDETPAPAPVASAPAPAPAPAPAVKSAPAPGPSGPAIALVAPPAEPERTRPASAAWLPTAFYSSLIGGGACLLGGVGFGLLAHSKASEVNEKFDSRTLTPDDKPLYDSARSRATTANVFYGLSALGFAGAAVFYLLDPAAISPGHGAGGDLSIGVSPQGVAAAGSF